MTRALLIQPPIYDFALYDLFHQPFGLLRIGRWLEGAGYEVDLIDALDPVPPGRERPGRGRFARQVVERPAALAGIDRQYARYGAPVEELRGRLSEQRPDVILVTTGMTYWYPGLAELAHHLREIHPGVPVIAGGVHASLMPDHCAEQLETDRVVAGPADRALAGVLSELGLPAPEGPVPRSGAVGLRAGSGRLTGAAAIRLAEGCPFRCSYCASPVLAPRFHPADPGELADHVAELHDRYGMRAFAFYDDALLHRAGHTLIPFLERIIRRFGERQLEFSVPNAVHIDLVDSELAELMYRAGFREMRFGLESTAPSFHSSVDSKLDLSRVGGAVESLKAAGFPGIDITAYILVGLPDQPTDTVDATLDDAANLGINVSLSEYSPVPGTPMFEAACAATGLDLRAEPLLHNNSVYAELSGAAGSGTMRALRERVGAIRRTLKA